MFRKLFFSFVVLSLFVSPAAAGRWGRRAGPIVRTHAMINDGRKLAKEVRELKPMLDQIERMGNGDPEKGLESLREFQKTLKELQTTLDQINKVLPAIELLQKQGLLPPLPTNGSK